MSILSWYLQGSMKAASYQRRNACFAHYYNLVGDVHFAVCTSDPAGAQGELMYKSCVSMRYHLQFYHRSFALFVKDKAAELGPSTMGSFILLLSVLAAISGVLTWFPEKAWWQHAIIYQCYTKSFADSDGDGIGDLKGLMAKKDYLKELGVNAVWLNPIYPSSGVDNGYDVTDFTGIDKVYGTMKDFEIMVKTFAESDMKVIMDFVPNHTSKDHEWFKKSVLKEAPYDDFYVWKDGKENKENKDGKPAPPNDWESIFAPGVPGSAWKWNEQRKQFYYHAFMDDQPDLNLRNPNVTNALKEVLKFWVQKGVKGFRLDAVLHLFEDESYQDNKEESHKYTQNQPETYDWIKDLRAFLTQLGGEDPNSEIFLTTEGYTNHEDTMRYYGSVFEPGAHFPFNFRFLTDLNDKTDAPSLHRNIVEYLANLKRYQFPNWVSGNHDWPRIPSRMGGRGAVDQLHMLSIMLPGTVTVYYGDEIGMDSYWNMDKDDCSEILRNDYRTPHRTPFQWNIEKNAGFTTNDKPWLPVNVNYYLINVDTQTKNQNSCYRVPNHLKNFKELAKLKKTEAIVDGKFSSYVINDQVYAFTRSDKNTIYLVLLNLSKKFSKPFDITKKIPEIGRKQARYAIARSVNILEECPYGDACADKIFSGTWNMPPKSGIVIPFGRVQQQSLYGERFSRGLQEDPSKCEPYWMADRVGNNPVKRFC
ncbi:maltase 2 isoform X2 [Bemisia tabaci]|uniref:maltase 2 isoform X2 n=1 Tax=Bemisia tabaci TaxID=7038 RepID=UPI003B28A929